VKIGITHKVCEGNWVYLNNLQSVALPTVMKKVIKQIPKEVLENF